MNVLCRRLQTSFTRHTLNQTLSSCRASAAAQLPVWDASSANERRYHCMPTHGIGSWKHLLAKRGPKKKKKERHQMKALVPWTEASYGTLNVMVSGHDMTLVEHFAQHVHQLCNRLSITTSLCYALPTRTEEVMLMQEHGTKMFVDATLHTHQRVVQLSSVNTTLCPVFMEVLLKNQPEGVHLSVKEHTEEDFRSRFKVRPQLQELMAQMNQ